MASSSSSSSAPEHHFDAHITLRPSQQALRPSPAETLALHAENRARLVAALRAPRLQQVSGLRLAADARPPPAAA